MKKLFMILIIGVFMLTACSEQEANQGERNGNEPTEGVQEDTPENSEPTNDDSNHQNDSEQPLDEFDKGRAEVVLTEYEKAFKKVINNTDDQLKQLEYTNKQGLKEHFEHFMSAEIAQSWVDTYFQEKEDGLYVIATEGPVFLQEDKPFTFTKTTDETATVVQERNNELIGHVKMKYTLKLNNDNIWFVDKKERIEIKE